MKTAKKILAVLLSVLMIGAMMVVFTACGDKDDKKAKSSKKADKSTSDEDKNETDEDEDSEDEDKDEDKDEDSKDEESEDEESEDVIETSKPSSGNVSVDKDVQKAVDAFIDGINNQDGDAIVSAMIPDDKVFWDYVEENDEVTRDDFVEIYGSLFAELGEVGPLTYDITSVSPADVSDIEDFASELEAAGLTVTEVQYIEGNLCAAGEEDPSPMYVYECGGKWYVTM